MSLLSKLMRRDHPKCIDGGLYEEGWCADHPSSEFQWIQQYEREEEITNLIESLNWLLNTFARSDDHKLYEDYPLVARSLINFGVQDMSTLILDMPEDQKRLASWIRQAITAYEPRVIADETLMIIPQRELTSVVSESSGQSITRRILCIEIQCHLMVDRRPQPLRLYSRYDISDRLFYTGY